MYLKNRITKLTYSVKSLSIDRWIMNKNTYDCIMKFEIARKLWQKMLERVCICLVSNNIKHFITRQEQNLQVSGFLVLNYGIVLKILI